MNMPEGTWKLTWHPFWALLAAGIAQNKSTSELKFCRHLIAIWFLWKLGFWWLMLGPVHETTGLHAPLTLWMVFIPSRKHSIWVLDLSHINCIREWNACAMNLWLPYHTGQCHDRFCCIGLWPSMAPRNLTAPFSPLLRRRSSWWRISWPLASCASQAEIAPLRMCMERNTHKLTT